MLFIQYHSLKRRYDEVEKEYQEMLKSNNTYICSVEMFKRRMSLKKEARDMIFEELSKIREELSYSKCLDDKIYYYCWIENKRLNKIYRLLPCSKSTSYNHRKNIESKLEDLFNAL